MTTLNPSALSAHLARELAPLYVLHGNDPLLLTEAADAIRAAARGRGHTEREVLVVQTGFRWDELYLAAGNLSLFGAAKVVDLRIPGGKPGTDGAAALARYCQRLPEGVVTVVSLPQLDWKARKAAWFVALGSAGVTVELNAPPLERLPAWIAQRLKAQGQSAGREALAFMASHVEGNLLAAHQEIQKLGLLYPPGELSAAQVQDAVLDVARYDVDQLAQAMLAADPGRCARLLDGLKAEGVAAPLVLWVMATQVRTLAGLRAGLDRGEALAELLRAARVFDEARRVLIQRLLPRLSLTRLHDAVTHAAAIDRMVKGLARGDVWDEFLQLALRLTDKSPA
ncbi:MAG: DNA polymerase III subunit delta [Betaproteobacteria bacterium]|nr:DNA polymerase III subunit delta [Betaproteobacteria bacterium]